MTCLRASIVIATRDKAPYLRRTLQSIYAQRVPFEFETIVVDDASSDATPEVTAEFPQVRYIRIDRDGGYLNPGPARNVGLRHATGDVVINNSDETEHVTPTSIEWLVERLEPGQCRIAQVWNVSPEGSRREIYTGSQSPRPLFFLGSAWRQDLYRVGANDEEFVQPGCDDTWLAECLIHGLGIHFVYDDDVVAHHHDHPRPANTNCAESIALFHRKFAEAEAGKHPWTAASGPWAFERGRPATSMEAI